jgi:UDP-glucose 4-epimerase
MSHAAVRGPTVYNVCTGSPTSVRRLAEAIAALSGAPPRLRFDGARVGDIRVSIGDGAKAKRELDFRSTTPFEEGLRSTLAALPQRSGARQAS